MTVNIRDEDGEYSADVCEICADLCYETDEIASEFPTQIQEIRNQAYN